MNQSAITYEPVFPRIEIRPLLRRVYLWMTFGVLVTTVLALLTVTTPALQALLATPGVVIGALIGELVLVVVLSAGINRLSTTAASLIFVGYAALVGFTLSSIFFVYRLGDISVAFLSATALFGTMTFVGFVTKADLTKLGTYLFVGLIGLIVAMFLNFFLKSSALDLIVSLVGVVIFTGLTAYDTQKISRLAADPKVQGQGAMLGKLSVLGALTLYLDFLNLFLLLLRLVGRRR